MRKISGKQKAGLAEFCANFAVAWLAVGIIPPVLGGIKVTQEVLQSGLAAFFWAGFSLFIMIVLLRGKNHE